MARAMAFEGKVDYSMIFTEILCDSCVATVDLPPSNTFVLAYYLT